ncbi:hypothetical protein ACLBYD_27715 [Rhodococcus sp. C26F]
MARTRNCDQAVRHGRMRKAEEFFELAEVGDYATGDGTVSDAVVTSWVLAGIAASDVLCCARLGVHAQGENHTEAVELLRSVDPTLAKHLQVLLRLKTRSSYTHTPTGRDDATRAHRAAHALMEAARRANT